MAVSQSLERVRVTECKDLYPTLHWLVLGEVDVQSEGRAKVCTWLALGK